MRPLALMTSWAARSQVGVMNRLASPLFLRCRAAHSQVAFQPHLLLSHALEENLSSLLHGPDEGPDTSDPASAFPEFPVGVEGAQEETLQTARLQHRHGSRWEPGGERRRHV